MSLSQISDILTGLDLQRKSVSKVHRDFWALKALNFKDIFGLLVPSMYKSP